MDFRRADLHTHTLHSDGALRPDALVERARQRGIRALAVTDHDTVDAYDEALEAGQRRGVEIIPGVELSVTVGEEEVHLLGYFFDPSHPGLRAHLSAFRAHRRARALQMVEALRHLGVDLTFGDVETQAKGGALGRPHVAAALVAGGHVETYADAFDRYLADGRPAFVAKPRFAAADALTLLHESGGIGVLAHPGDWISGSTITRLIDAGLDGIEVVHPSHSVELSRYYRQLARDAGLTQTGGSDYHGHRPGDDLNLGRYSIPYAWLDRLRRAA